MTQGSIRVLALEDDPDTLEVFSLLLTPEDGYALDRCDTVDGCLACLQRAATAGEPYAVLVIDLLLSQGHTGVEVIEAARANRALRVPPIVICTAVSPAKMDTYKPALDGFDTRIIFKPFDLDALQATIRAAAGLGPPSP